MQMRCARIRISSRSYKTDDIPTLDPHPLPQTFRVAIQVRVVVAIHSGFVELVYGVTARFAKKKFADSSGCHRVHGCPSWLHNVDRFMAMSVVNFFEAVPKIGEGESIDGWGHIENAGGSANKKKRGQKHGDAKIEPQTYSSRVTLSDALSHSSNKTAVPFLTRSATRVASQFVIRTHP